MGTNIAEVSWERVQENLEIIEFPKRKPFNRKNSRMKIKRNANFPGNCFSEKFRCTRQEVVPSNLNSQFFIQR